MKLFKSIKKRLKVRTMIAIMLIIVMLPILLLSLYHPSGTDAATWNFDEGYGNPTDSSGSALATTLSGALWKTDDLCLSGKCLYFDGADDYVSTSSTTVFDAGGTYTVMAWIRPTFGGESATETFISKTGVVDFNISDTNDNVVVAYTGGTTASSNNNVITANKWHHVAITHNGTGTIAIYVDGNDQTSDASVTDSNSAASTLFGSELTAASTQSYQGFMDVVKIYTSQLTAAQIKAEYSSTAATESGISASVGSGQADSQAYLSDGLVGYWKMDESSWGTPNCSDSVVLDSSGNGNNGTACPNSTGPAGGAIGKFGNAGDFDGSNDYVSVADAGATDTLRLNGSQNLSIGAWVKVDNLASSTQHFIVSKYSYASQTGYALLIENTGAISFNINGGANPKTTSATPITAGSWYHIFAVFKDGNTMQIYLNGTLQESFSITSTTLSQYTSALGIGSPADGLGNDFYSLDGQIDETRVYNRALSPAEISGIYNFAPGPVAHFALDENTGTSTTYDKSGNGYTGALTSITSSSWVPGKYGSALDLDGGADYVDIGTGPTKVNTVEFWVKPTTTTEYFVNLTSTTDYIWANAGTVTATGLSSPTIYVNGVVSSTISAGSWQHVAVVTSTAENASNFDIGRTTDSNYLQGTIDDVRIYNYARTAGQIVQDMNAGHPLGGSPIGSQVGYWKFDEMANDTCSGGSNDVCNSSSLTTTLDGTSTASRTASGKLNAALDFDGTDDVVTITNTSSIDFDTGLSSGFTISAWVNPDTVGESSAGQIFQKGANTYCQLSSSTPFTVTCNLDYATTDANTSVSSAIPSGSWTHVAMSYNSTAETISIWINGRKRATSSAGTGGKAADTASLLIGGGTSNNFDGKIDEFKVYSAELTTAEMQIDYNYNSALAVSTGQTEDGVGTPPVGWWKFDDNTGSTAYDISGNGNNAALTNSPTWQPGKIGSSLLFNGSNNYASVPDPVGGELDFGTGSFTVGGWVYISSLDFDGRAINKGTQSWATGYNFELDNSNGNRLFFLYGGGTQATSILLFPSASLFTIPGWVHVEAVVDQTNDIVKYYVNGVQASVTPAGSTCNSGAGTVYDFDISSCTSLNSSSGSNLDFGAIKDGGGPGTPSNLFPGGVDDVRIYNYARSQAQVAYDYNGGLPSAHYQMDECTGTTIYNNAVNAQGGAFGVNGTWSGASGGNTSAGTCTTSGAWFNGATGKFNSSLDFDGTDDAVSVTNASIIDLNDNLRNGFTFSTWIYPNSDGEGDVGKIFYKNASTYCQTDSDDGTFVDIQCQVDLATDASLNVADACRLNQWCHVAFSWTNDSDDEVTIWINGVATTSSAANSGDTATDTANLIIGGNATGASNTNAFDGQIDDFRVYPYELTAAQIKMVINQAAAARFGPATGTPQP